MTPSETKPSGAVDLKLHQAIAGTRQGGVGPGVSPSTALAVGLKVDLDALPRSLRAALAQGRVDLSDPAVTVALLKLNAVVGVTGFFDRAGRIESWEFNAGSVTRPSTIPSPAVSGTGLTAGQIAT